MSSQNNRKLDMTDKVIILDMFLENFPKREAKDSIKLERLSTTIFDNNTLTISFRVTCDQKDARKMRYIFTKGLGVYGIAGEVRRTAKGKYVVTTILKND